MAWWVGIEILILVSLSLVGMLAVLLPQLFPPIYIAIAIGLAPMLSLLYILEWGLKIAGKIAQWQRKAQIDLLALQPDGLPVLLWGLLQQFATPRLLGAVPCLALSMVLCAIYQALFTQEWPPVFNAIMLASGINLSMMQFTVIAGLPLLLGVQSHPFHIKTTLILSLVMLHFVGLVFPIAIRAPVFWMGGWVIGETIVWALWRKISAQYGQTPI